MKTPLQIELEEYYEKEAAKIWGKSYVKIPRSLLANIFSPDSGSPKEALLHLALIFLCYYADGNVFFKGEMYTCHKGEYIGTQLDLAEYTGIKKGSINRMLKRMEEKGLISIKRIQGGSRIRVYGYCEFNK